MFWEKRIVRILAAILMIVLVFVMLLLRSNGDISCLYTNF